MGRSLNFSFYRSHPEVFKEKQDRAEEIYEKHRDEIWEKEYGRSGHAWEDAGEECKCEDCQFTRQIKEDYFDSDDDATQIHSRTGHDLPYDHYYSKEEILKDLNKFLQAEKYYEVSVLAYVLDEWPTGFETCHLQYN